jgi:hypothetical protein
MLQSTIDFKSVENMSHASYTSGFEGLNSGKFSVPMQHVGLVIRGPILEQTPRENDNEDVMSTKRVQTTNVSRTGPAVRLNTPTDCTL